MPEKSLKLTSTNHYIREESVHWARKKWPLSPITGVRIKRVFVKRVSTVPLTIDINNG